MVREQKKLYLRRNIKRYQNFRYQKKISTYDKQQWEKTVEQRILSGFIHVPLKNTKLKTELIDVDLVRGKNKTKNLFPIAK